MARLAVFACVMVGVRASAVEDAGIRVVVTIPPLKGLIEPLLPEGSTVTVLMPPGRSEHNYEFTPADMAEVGRADIVLYVGLGLEPQVMGFLDSHRSERRVDVCFAEAVGVHAEGVDEHREGTERETAHRDEADEHNHGDTDPHVWLDPVLVQRALPRLADAVGRALALGAPADAKAKARLATSLDALIAKVGAVDGDYRKQLGPLKGSKIVTHHAAFGRLVERYGLVIAEVIRMSEGAEPTPGRIASIVKAVESEGVKVIFVEPQFNGAVAERIARAAGVKVGVLDPLGDGDWFAMMKGNLEALVKGLKEEGK